MSKSLKNFITIKEILHEYTPFQIRMLFLTQQWNKSFNFRKESLDKAKNNERYFLEFLTKVKTLAIVRTLEHRVYLSNFNNNLKTGSKRATQISKMDRKRRRTKLSIKINSTISSRTIVGQLWYAGSYRRITGSGQQM